MQNESSGAGCHAVGAQRLPVGRGTGTTALPAGSTTKRAPQGCNATSARSALTDTCGALEMYLCGTCAWRTSASHTD